MPPTQRDALILPDNDLTMHAGEQIFGVSRYSEEDPDQSRNDLDSMHTFSAVPPDHESIHPDWIGRFSAAVSAKHLGGMEGDGAKALRPSLAQANASYMTVAVQNVTGSCKPYHKAGFPNDDCRFAAWTAMVRSGLVDIASWSMPTAARWIYNDAKPTPALWEMLPQKVHRPRPRHRVGSRIRWRVSRL